MKVILLFLFILIPQIVLADTNSNQAALLIQDENGTNAGRYRVLKFSNGSTTNNGDGSVSVTSGGGSGSGNVGIGTPNYLSQYIGISTLGPSNVVNVAGNIGINTTTPSARLDVNGSLQVGNSVNSTAISTNVNGYASIISPGNRLGVGTTLPQTALDVQGTVRSSGFILTTSPTNGYILTSDANGSGTWQANGGSSGSNYWNLSPGNVGINTANNVGISSTNPSQKLDVNGTVRMTGFQLPTNPSSGYVLTSDSVGVGTWSPSSGSTSPGGSTNNIQYNNSGSFGGASGFYSDGAGNVSIGTNTLINIPLYLYVSGNSSILDIQSGNTGAAAIIKFLGETGGTARSFIQYNNSLTTNTNLINLRDSLVLESDSGAAGGISFVTNSSSPIRFGTGGTSIASNQRMIIDASGNVGINQGSPINKLDVGAGMVVGASYAGTNTAPSNGLIVQGNVGVGSTNPGTKLDVNGTVRSNSFITTGGSSSQFVKGDGTLDSSTYSTATGANPTASVSTSAVNGVSTSFMRADGAPAIDQTMTPTWTGTHTFNNSSVALQTGTGNVGINSVTPGQILDVQGTVRSIGFILSGNGASSGNVLVSNSIGLGTWLPASSLPITGSSQWTTTNTNDVYLPNLGNVGIGTTMTTGGSLIVMNGNVGIGTVTPPGIFYVKGTQNIFEINPNGNVGIGTINRGTGYLEVGTTSQFAVTNAGAVSTTSPSSFTANNANATIANSSTTAASMLTINAGASTTSGLVLNSTTHAQPNTTDSIILKMNNGVEVMRLQNNSAIYNVGIGSNNPGAQLDVVGTVSLTHALVATNLGNVGINSLTPGQRLDVVGTVRVIGGSGAANTAACWCADGIRLGHASAVVVISGAATCNDASGVC